MIKSGRKIPQIRIGRGPRLGLHLPRWRKPANRAILFIMIVIRRLVDRQRAYTAIFLPGEEPRIFPTTEYEHGRILQIYKQDRPHEGIINDFSDFGIGPEPVPPATGARSPRRRA